MLATIRGARFSVGAAAVICVYFACVLPASADPVPNLNDDPLEELLIAAGYCGRDAPDPGCTVYDPFDDARSLAVDEDGDLITDPIFPSQIIPQLGVKPIGAPSEILHYLDVGAIGPLSAEAASDATVGGQGGSAASGAALSGACDLYDPRVIGYREERRSPPYGYYGEVGAGCERAGVRVTSQCYVELWRVRDGAYIDNGNDTGNNELQCVASANTGFRYKRRTAHYAKGYVELALSRGFWGYGRGPRGWSCDGQGTASLRCRKNSDSDA